MKKFLIKENDYENLRIDKWLKKQFSQINQSFIEKNLRKGNIKVNGLKINSNYKLNLNDEVIIFNFHKEIYLNKLKIKSKVYIPSKYKKLFFNSTIYENDDFIVLDKWNGIATQGGSKVNISIDDIIKNISDNYKLVHRLDRETSGLLLIAKNLKSAKFFGSLFKEHQINKVYVAICQGSPKNNQSEVKLLIPDKKNKNKSSVSVTNYEVFQTKNKLSNIIFAPKTGKTHQIRMVAKFLSCPIVGDTKYNIQKNYNYEKLKLNAYYLSFKMKNDFYEFYSKLPEHYEIFLKKNKFKPININKFL